MILDKKDSEILCGLSADNPYFSPISDVLMPKDSIQVRIFDVFLNGTICTNDRFTHN